MIAMATEDEVVEAFEDIERAWEHYRTTLRSYLADGLAEGVSGRQAAISKRLNRTREMLRRDVMTDEQRDALRHAEAERKRLVAKKTAADQSEGLHESAAASPTNRAACLLHAPRLSNDLRRPGPPR